ncbi:triphosphoribosyl-dephospho-CoA synthase [Pseudomonas sp. F1_0610]|uniref:triphosphoribosyl-dephospho-CoA synthase n=1 Tax=Pseudomonas sp. F1_0610 TaxID=3114284 RepID=UPI0039C2A71C
MAKPQARVCATQWAEYLANSAVQALLDEVQLTPKPGLVDRRGSGAHSDLTLELMQASAHSLWPTFYQMAIAAQVHPHIDQSLRESMGAIGRLGEAQMLKCTQGVNTHRGAIWALGLLVVAASLAPFTTAQELTERAAQLALIEDRYIPQQGLSNGAKVRQKYAVSGAREQAQQGFPSVHLGLKQLLKSRQQGASEKAARVDALLAIASELADTCVLHRSGLEGLMWMQQQARKVLALGGYSSALGQQQFQQLETGLLARNASPGGAADLLAASLWIDSILPASAQEGSV